MRSVLSLFAKRPAANVQLSVGAAAERQPTSGLIVLEISASADRPLDAELQLFVGDARTPAYRKPLAVGPEAQSSWLAVHGHLLPNGAVPLRLELREGGPALAAAALTVQVRNEGEVALRAAESLRRQGAPLVIDGACDSRRYDYGDPSLAAWFDRGPEEIEAHLADLAARGAATDAEIAALRHFTQEGYLVVEDVVDAGHLARLNQALDDAVEKKIEGYEWGSSQRLHNLHQQYPAIKELWLHPKILRMLELIFGVPARPCQSLTYVFGSQQEHHQDTIHLTPFPAGRMCGVWTALEDVQPDSGELMVFPKSHRLPRVYMDTVGLPKVTNEDWAPFGATVVPHWTDLIVKNGLGSVPYRPKAGTSLIWHENLMHGGAPRRDMTKSRRSIVGHYFADGAIVYYDSSGMPGGVYAGE
jgi:ectoine hydroxylase-related dioxygenase (phytanoyl-CoA dioxygenase family)